MSNTPLGRDAGEIAIEYGISREEQDAITVVKKRISCDVHIINDGGLK
ncbi:MAG: hypothetical protein QMD11_03290 [Smithella sp.]|nr:hypothetical protein [Smithella sp.]